MKKYIILFMLSGLVLMYSCEEYLEKEPYGLITEEVLSTPSGINSLLIGAYAQLDGWGGGGGIKPRFTASVSGWIAELMSDNAYKGEVPENWSDLNVLEQWNIDISNQWSAWVAHYDGIARCNDVLRVVDKALEEGTITQDEADQFDAEAIFIRSHHYFQLQQKYHKVPYITEGDFLKEELIPNDVLIWDEIEADLQVCINNLPVSQADPGRPTKYSAQAMLARVHLMQGDYAAAKAPLDAVIAGPFVLMDVYYDNFDEEHQNIAESIFEVQYSVNDGSNNSANGNWDYGVIYPRGGDIQLGVDYFHPSYDLYNAFKVDSVTGLPLLDSFQDDFLLHDLGLTSDDDFTQPEQYFDPRIDYTIGRRGIPYLDWGVHRGTDWTFVPYEIGGAFKTKKAIFWKRNQGTLSTTTGWARGVNSNNFRMFRLAHILLWRAEVAVEEDDLATALTLVNQVRTRAGNNVVMGKVADTKLPLGSVPVVDYNQPAADYLVSPYPSFPDQAYARKAVRMETRLESALEGFRWFDLQRWGIAADVLNPYAVTDALHRTYMQGATYEHPKDSKWPIPLEQIDLQKGVLEQNPDYN